MDYQNRPMYGALTNVVGNGSQNRPLYDALTNVVGNESAIRNQNMCLAGLMNQYSAMMNVTLPMIAYRQLTNVFPQMNEYNCRKPEPKSGRKIWRDMGNCWIVVAHESGPLKLLELELK